MTKIYYFSKGKGTD